MKDVSDTRATAPDLADVLAEHAPFDSLDDAARAELVRVAEVNDYSPGELILDAFADPQQSVYVVVGGLVGLWNEAGRLTRSPDEVLESGGVFGFSAMLTERSVGPRASAISRATVARLPDAQAAEAFATRRGARFLARNVTLGPRRNSTLPAFSRVDDVIHGAPLVVEAASAIADVARLMSERRLPYAVVRFPDGDLGLVTDASLRNRVIAQAVSRATQIGDVASVPPPRAAKGEAAAEVLIRLLEAGQDAAVLTDRRGQLIGVATLRDLCISPMTSDISLHDQLRRARTVDELAEHARKAPDLLEQLLSRGLASGPVITAYSGVLDTLIRRAIELIFAEHDQLSTDAFTWMALGSNGRREAVLSSDVDSAAAFVDGTSAQDMAAYREAFARIDDVLVAAGLSSDTHGATARRRLFSRTNSQWRDAARSWLANPIEDQGATMTSLLVDGRPIYGDPGMPAAARVFNDLREHPGTMRLLLEESLSARAKRRSTRDAVLRRNATFDIKAQALLPLVNLARWTALSVQSPVLSTVDRLHTSAGSAMLPESQATILIEVFEVLQRLRLRYQLMQHRDGRRPSDRVTFELMSPIDRSVVGQAVREIASAQRRLANVAAYLSTEEWTTPEHS